MTARDKPNDKRAEAENIVDVERQDRQTNPRTLLREVGPHDLIQRRQGLDPAERLDWRNEKEGKAPAVRGVAPSSVYARFSCARCQPTLPVEPWQRGTGRRSQRATECNTTETLPY